MSGTKRYLLIKHVGNQLDFSIATYMFDEPKKATSNSVVVAKDKKVFFAQFTGILTVKHLATGKSVRFEYQNGVTPQRKITSPAAASVATSATPTTAAQSANNYICETYTTCYWTAYCRDRNGNYSTNGAMTSGQNGNCQEPGQEPCDSWNTSFWRQTDSESYDQCYWEEPPPPPADPPGSGGGGDDNGGFNDGGTTNYEVIDDECQGLKIMVGRQSVPGGYETGAYYTTDGHIILLPTVGNTSGTINISFPYKDSQDRTIINIGQYPNGSWYIDVSDYSTGSANITTYDIAYFVHSHPVGSGFQSDIPSAEDKSNAANYPGIRQHIVNENNFIEYNKDGVIAQKSFPLACPF